MHDMMIQPSGIWYELIKGCDDSISEDCREEAEWWVGHQKEISYAMAVLEYLGFAEMVDQLPDETAVLRPTKRLKKYWFAKGDVAIINRHDGRLQAEVARLRARTKCPPGSISEMQRSRFVQVDEPLAALLFAQSIDDPDEKMLICDALVAVGLAEHKMFAGQLDPGSREHVYTSTKAMRKLAKEWLVA